MTASSYIIAIGASAGGLVPIKQIIGQMPAELNAAVVIISHLPVDFRSSMAALFKDRTSVMVTEVSDGVVLQPGHLYIIPAGADARLVSLSQERLCLSDEPRPTNPIYL